MSIPVLGIPILNRGDLLVRLIDSIGDKTSPETYPVDQIVVINNGNESDVEHAILMLKYYFDHKLHVIKPYENWGCSKSWNYILKNYMKDYVAICANDVSFGEGDLEIVESHIQKDREENLGKMGTISYAGVGYGFFIMNKDHLKIAGYFDENFYPAYYEDMDYNYRMKMIDAQFQAGKRNDVVSMRNIKKENGEDLKLIHGETHRTDLKINYESATIHSNEIVKACNNITFWENLGRYTSKWGGDRNKEKYVRPFHDDKNELHDWEIDEDDLRRKQKVWNDGIFKGIKPEYDREVI